MKKYQFYLQSLFKNKKSIFLFGLFFAFAITLKEVINLSYNNFQIFSYGSIDFWQGINPYSDWHHLNAKGKPLDVFIYLPVFSILFTPFALLPSWLGAFCWNFFTYSMFYLSIFNLPSKYHFKDKKFIFFISCLLLFATQLSMQFNPLVVAFFLFSYTLLEKNRSFLAILLLLLSGFMKVYGIFQLAMLLLYPKFWKNVIYTLFVSLGFLLLPLIRFTPNELIIYYESWIVAITQHSEMGRFYSMYRPIFYLNSSINEYASIISIAVLLLLCVLLLFKIKTFQKSFPHRAQFLGILMSWLILFGLSSELHTYVIAMVGYAIWYVTIEKTKTDKILLWLNFFLLAVFPIDIICPTVISKFILGELHLGVIVFFITWVLMIYKTFGNYSAKV